MSNSSVRRLTLLLAALAVSALLAAGAWVLGSGLSGSQEELPYIPLAADKSMGVNADLSALDLVTLDETLANMRSAGFRWLRQRFPWYAVEMSPGTYDWSTWDRIVEGADNHDIKLVAVLDGSPDWARAEEDAGNPLAPPRETRDFGDFAAALAERYGAQVDYHQIWDEPNISPHWGAREVDPEGYARLLREGAIRIRSADDDAKILLAALAPNVEAGGENMSDLLFLDALYRAAAAEWFDLVAAQPYPFQVALEAQPMPGELSWRRVELLREVMLAHADDQTAIWATSFGVQPPDPGAISEVVEQVRADWPWMGAMLWAAWSPGDQRGQYALVGTDGNPQVVLDVLHATADAQHWAWPGAYPANHPSGSYEGDWLVTPLGADIGRDGDQLAVRFRGTQLDLTVRRGGYRAFLFVTVDGEPANALPLDAGGQAYVVLYDPLNRVDTVTLARGLANGEHVAEIKAERGWGQWAIVGWAVSREMPAHAATWLARFLALGALLALAAAVYLGWPERGRILKSAFARMTACRALDARLVLLVAVTLAVLLYVMTSDLLVLVVLGILALLLLARPDAGLPLVAFALPFYQLGRPMFGKAFSMVEILLVLTAVGWMLNWLLERWNRLSAGVSESDGEGFVPLRRGAARLTGADWAVVSLVAVAACSLVWAEEGREAAREFRTVILEAGVFYALLRAMLPSLSAQEQVSGSAWRVVDAWVLGGALIALVGLGQWVFGENLIAAEGVGRVRGLYGSPNNLALYVGRLLPLAVAFAAWGRNVRRRWAYGVAGILMAATLFLTYSRGAWIVGVPASLLFLAALRGRRALAVTVGVLLVLATLVLLLVGPGRLTSLFDTGTGTTFFRLQLWRSSVAMVRDHPLLGVGLDNFLYAYRSRYVLPTAWAEFDLSHPHNFVLDFWLRLGIAGLMVIVWLLVAFFRKGWAQYRRAPEGDARALAAGLLAGMVNFAAHGLVDNAFFLVDLAFTFMLMLALVQLLDGGEHEPSGASDSRVPAAPIQ